MLVDITANLPSDFASRNAPDCDHPQCQICQFINTLEQATVNSISVNDILTGKVMLPFTTRSTWRSTQLECPDICRSIAQLKQGTRPSKKITNAKDIKRYLHSCSVACDGLLIVRREEPFTPTRECIGVPRNALAGLLTALHIQLKHPTPYQLKQVMTRHFLALDLDKSIDVTSNSCHQCASLKQVPSSPVEQSTSDPPSNVGIRFSCDIIRRSSLFIFLIRECIPSFTSACIIPDEKRSSLCSGLLQLILPLHPVNAPAATVRTDPAPGFQALARDHSLIEFNISLDLGQSKNINKNPIAEKEFQELEKEILQQDLSGDPISSVSLACTVSRLNTQIRNCGLSAHEMWFQHEQFTNIQLYTPDDHLITSQHSKRLDSHKAEQNKSLRRIPPKPSLQFGDIVYLRSEKSKMQARTLGFPLLQSMMNSIKYICHF